MEGWKEKRWLGGWVVGEEVDGRQWTVHRLLLTVYCFSEPPNHLTTHSRFTLSPSWGDNLPVRRGGNPPVG